MLGLPRMPECPLQGAYRKAPDPTGATSATESRPARRSRVVHARAEEQVVSGRQAGWGGGAPRF